MLTDGYGNTTAWPVLSVGTHRILSYLPRTVLARGLLSLDKPGAMRRVRVLTGSRIYRRSGGTTNSAPSLLYLPSGQKMLMNFRASSSDSRLPIPTDSSSPV